VLYHLSHVSILFFSFIDLAGRVFISKVTSLPRMAAGAPVSRKEEENLRKGMSFSFKETYWKS
jgi:hypothetical protein